MMWDEELFDFVKMVANVLPYGKYWKVIGGKFWISYEKDKKTDYTWFMIEDELNKLLEAQLHGGKVDYIVVNKTGWVHEFEQGFKKQYCKS